MTLESTVTSPPTPQSQPHRTATQLRYSLGDCSLGKVLVAQSERGICAILLGDSPQDLATELDRRFPMPSTAARDDAALAPALAKVIALIEAPSTGLDLPLDLLGTDFQQRVWSALRDIPAGQTRSYGELARHLGAPNASRAVALACAANPLAVAIPCHRVLRGDGHLSGYRWGTERKRALLERELGLYCAGAAR